MVVKVVTCKLRVTQEAAVALAETMACFNAACNALSEISWATRTFRAHDLHHAAYCTIRSQFALPAQLVIRAIAKVADSYKSDRSTKHTFGPRSAVVCDTRCFKLTGLSSAELTTTRGRLQFGLMHGKSQRQQLKAGKVGEADLLYRDGHYYLAISVKTPDPPAAETTDGALGVDLGIVELATDSLGHAHSGEQVKTVRRRLKRLRSLLQAKGTKSAKRHLKKIKRKQSRFVHDTNHRIAKAVVKMAITTKKALALEELKGIRQRASGYSREMRWLLGNWAFDDLGAKIRYKAAAAGVRVIWLDPRNTSRTCARCGHCEKANRKTQSRFLCLECGWEANADYNAALVLAARAALSDGLLSQLGLPWNGARCRLGTSPG
jgi:putative transposase